jgi:predicted ester cyclase
MSTEENKALMRRAYEAVNQGDLTAFFELFTPDFVLHNGSMTIQGLEAFKQIEAMLLTALPDLHYTVEDLIAEGDKVAVRLTARGTQHGGVSGRPPNWQAHDGHGIRSQPHRGRQDRRALV